MHVSRDLWPWPWAHPGCRLTCRPSCASLVAIRPFACEKKQFSWSARITWPLTLTLSKTWMRAHRLTILCKFGRNRAIFVVVEAICAKKVYRQTDTHTHGQTTDDTRLYYLMEWAKLANIVNWITGLQRKCNGSFTLWHYDVTWCTLINKQQQKDHSYDMPPCHSYCCDNVSIVQRWTPPECQKC